MGVAVFVVVVLVVPCCCVLVGSLPRGRVPVIVDAGRRKEKRKGG